jgi:hypothetical protein
MCFCQLLEVMRYPLRLLLQPLAVLSRALSSFWLSSFTYTGNKIVNYFVESSTCRLCIMQVNIGLLDRNC